MTTTKQEPTIEKWRMDFIYKRHLGQQGMCFWAKPVAPREPRATSFVFRNQ